MCAPSATSTTHSTCPLHILSDFSYLSPLFQRSKTPKLPIREFQPVGGCNSLLQLYPCGA
jgi:hypothetical protein